MLVACRVAFGRSAAASRKGESEERSGGSGRTDAASEDILSRLLLNKERFMYG